MIKPWNSIAMILVGLAMGLLAIYWPAAAAEEGARLIANIAAAAGSVLAGAGFGALLQWSRNRRAG